MSDYKDLWQNLHKVPQQDLIVAFLESQLQIAELMMYIWEQTANATDKVNTVLKDQEWLTYGHRQVEEYQAIIQKLTIIIEEVKKHGST